jgi:hypothetical protein
MNPVHFQVRFAIIKDLQNPVKDASAQDVEASAESNQSPLFRSYL